MQNMQNMDNFDTRCVMFRSILIMHGFEYIILTHIKGNSHVYRKNDIIFQICKDSPEDIRTWEHAVNLVIYDNFEDAINSDRLK